MNPVSKTVSESLKITKIAKFSLIMLLVLLVKPVLANQQPRNIISSIYFNSENSFVVETANLVNLKPNSIEKIDSGNFILNFSDVRITKNISSKISTQNFEIELVPLKSAQQGLFKSFDELRILVKSKTPKKHLDLNSRVLLSGYASEYKLSYQDIVVPEPVLDSAPPPEVSPIQASEPVNHRLKISINQDSLKATQELLERIQQPDLLNNTKLIEEINEKMDLVSLEQIANYLSSKGQKNEAELALRKLLSIDPSNNKALMALADLTSDPQEKIQTYLQVLDPKALDALADSWSLEKRPESLAKAVLMRQIAILKDPHNSKLRLECAQIYESMGFSYYSLSAKRYLESAVLAKNQYLAGDLESEKTLRTATESLIRLLSTQGDQEMAIKYCHSYLDLGFRRFTDGKPIVAIIKELQTQRQN
jgi:tetratricopeptide (TPR) repeat protein